MLLSAVFAPSDFLEVVVVVVDVVDAFEGRVGEIAAMDDEIDVLPFRVGEDAVEPFP